MAGHLVVLVHGMWGSHVHFDYINQQLALHGAQEYLLGSNCPVNKDLVVYRTRDNTGYLTYDGVDICGQRVANEVSKVISEICPSQLSMVGYSMGGLISRYAVGVLYSRGTFEKVKPCTFTAFASPHIGCNVLGTGLSERAFNFIGSWSMARTSRQAFLRDKYTASGTPLFKHMTDESSTFVAAMRLFSKRALYANILNDRRCDYYTAASETDNPYAGIASFDLQGFWAAEKYAPVVLDGSKSPSKKHYPVRKKSLWQRLVHSLDLTLRLSVVWPLWFIAFLINVAYQGAASWLRTQQMVKSGIIQLNYEHTEEIAADMVEDIYSSVSDPTVFRFTPLISSIVRQFNALGWEKYPVRVIADKNAHAAIIVRNPDQKTFWEGKIVVDHWINEVLCLRSTTSSEPTQADLKI